MDAAMSFETLVSYHISIGRNNPEELNIETFFLCKCLYYVLNYLLRTLLQLLYIILYYKLFKKCPETF